MFDGMINAIREETVAACIACAGRISAASRSEDRRPAALPIRPSSSSP
ncbi:MAG: hypothetical protein ACLTG4_12510 [Oscillospiraceae bacterium]